MDDFVLASTVLLWVALLISLLLHVRTIAWIRQRNVERRMHLEQRAALQVGSIAPDFHAQLLDGRLVEKADFDGRRVAFIFMSPLCNECRHALPDLQQLAPKARDASGVEFVLVSDRGASETNAWLDLLRQQDDVTVELPMIVAEGSGADFVRRYNATGATPAFVLVDEYGSVESGSLLVAPEWGQLRRNWEGRRRLAPWMTR